MGNGTAKRPAKPEKPTPDFPLFPHASGVWAKKIAGRMRYFGPWSDPDGALRRYKLERSDLERGRRPRQMATGHAQLTVKDACNHFLHAKAKQRDSGDIVPRTWTEYERTALFLMNALGRDRDVADLDAQDFVELRAKMVEQGLGPVSIGNEVQRIRTLFKYAYEASLLDKPVRFGPTFKRASKKTLRQAKARRGPRMFQAVEIRTLLDKSSVHLRAMILLAVNLGYGNTDCGRLPLSAVDLKSPWISFARPKTAIARRGWLWPETITALRESLAKRKAPKPPADGLFFVTKRGLSWAKETSDAPITKEFAKLLATANLKRPGINFYSLRRTHRTIADAAGDQPAADLIMGHARDDMASEYREVIEDKRVAKVCRHVRNWLFADKKKSRARRSR